jgi:hypothetical protein
MKVAQRLTLELKGDRGQEHDVKRGNEGDHPIRSVPQSKLDKVKAGLLEA